MPKLLLRVAQRAHDPNARNDHSPMQCNHDSLPTKPDTWERTPKRLLRPLVPSLIGLGRFREEYPF
jgi:hypothetical protein